MGLLESPRHNKVIGLASDVARAVMGIAAQHGGDTGLKQPPQIGALVPDLALSDLQPQKA